MPKTHLPIALPVRILDDELMTLFSTIGDIEDFNNALFDGLAPLVVREDENVPITCAAKIDYDPSEKIAYIHSYENYNQFLWCLSYSIYILQEGNTIDKDKLSVDAIKIHPIINEAMEVFFAGMNLFTSFDGELFDKIPNPRSPHNEYKERVEIVNQIYFAASLFILFHEFSHYHCKHLKSNVEDKVALAT